VIGSYVPRLVGAVLLPFQGKIIYDGLVSMPDVVITFGAGAKRMFNDSYRAAKARYGIVTSLPMETKPMKGRSGTARRKKAAGSREVYQFKLTLKDVHPAVWRRIQVEDCTLDELHRHIQASMGWMNCHLYQFEIGGELYGDPGLLNDGWSAADVVDSGRTKLSKLLPKEGRSFRFRYEYDFGDGWMHDVLFERTVDAESGARFPVCVAGARACPPEDCGGAFGYEGLLEAIEDSNHPDHEDVLDWVGGRFDPEKFHPEQATKLMRQGL
jgi:hypothetical protein